MSLLKDQERLTPVRVVIARNIGAITYSEFKRRAIFVVVAVAVGVATLLAIWAARVVLLVLFGGFLGALVLATLTSFAQRWLRIPRPIAFVALLAGLVGAVVFTAWLRGPELMQQFSQLQVDLPDAARRIYLSLDGSRWGRWVLENTPQSGEWSSWFTYAASGIGGALSVITSALACMLLVIMASIYLAAEPAFYRQFYSNSYPSRLGKGLMRACGAQSILCVSGCFRGWSQ